MNTHPEALTQVLPFIPVDDRPPEVPVADIAAGEQAMQTGETAVFPHMDAESTALLPRLPEAEEYSSTRYSSLRPRPESTALQPAYQELYVQDPLYPGQWTVVQGDPALDVYDETTRRAVTDPHVLAALNGTPASVMPETPAAPAASAGPADLPHGLFGAQPLAEGDHHVVVGTRGGRSFFLAESGSKKDPQFASAVRNMSNHVSEMHGLPVADEPSGRAAGRRKQVAETDDDFQGTETDLWEDAEEAERAFLRPPKRGGKLGQARIRDRVSVGRIANPYVRRGARALIVLALLEGLNNGVHDVAHYLLPPTHIIHPEYLIHFDPMQPIHDAQLLRGKG